MPPSTDISRLLPAAVRFTSAIFMVMGGMVPMVMLYLAQLPTVILERSVAIGVGGPWVICADAVVGETTATATIEATNRRATRRGERCRRRSIGDVRSGVHRANPEETEPVIGAKRPSFARRDGARRRSHRPAPPRAPPG